MSKEKTYAVQDSDWAFYDADYPAEIVRATSPEQAALKGVQQMYDKGKDGKFDGCTVAVAELVMTDTVLSFYIEDGKAKKGWGQ